jgi:hypothetical protein
VAFPFLVTRANPFSEMTNYRPNSTGSRVVGAGEFESVQTPLVSEQNSSETDDLLTYSIRHTLGIADIPAIL